MPDNAHFVTSTGGTTSDVSIDLSGLAKLERAALDLARSRAKPVCEEWAQNEITPWMKTNRPWTDRTHNAKNSLGVEQEYGEEFILKITGGVFYMKYLETRFAGRYAILQPAFDEWVPELLARLGAEVVR